MSESLKLKKLTFFLFSFVALNGCVDATAFLGPAITIGNTGNIYQASLSYGTNQVVFNSTGKTTIEHVTAFLDPTDEFEGDLNLILKDSIKDVKKDFDQVVNKTQKKLQFKEKVKPEPILSSRLGNFNFSLEDQVLLF